ncbi:hypothetical protein BDP27DRAFT_1446257 [Rhodocollybia butyracea]|uniref:Uncharacterized protein n=1 Tax=Rhodocollybia butyracea TaxID=206335 RepID=A0A9P5PY51_9AGAR|nr:hypothetical protein BDP27DRAFT_1446257 [Rhodocollybia butyracea]
MYVAPNSAAKKILDRSANCGDSFTAIRPGPSLDWLIELEHREIVSVVHLKAQAKHLQNVIKLALKLAKKSPFPVQFDLEPNEEELEDSDSGTEDCDVAETGDGDTDNKEGGRGVAGYSINDDSGTSGNDGDSGHGSGGKESSAGGNQDGAGNDLGDSKKGGIVGDNRSGKAGELRDNKPRQCRTTTVNWDTPSGKFAMTLDVQLLHCKDRMIYVFAPVGVKFRLKDFDEFILEGGHVLFYSKGNSIIALPVNLSEREFIFVRHRSATTGAKRPQAINTIRGTYVPSNYGPLSGVSGIYLIPNSTQTRASTCKLQYEVDFNHHERPVPLVCTSYFRLRPSNNSKMREAVVLIHQKTVNDIYTSPGSSRNFEINLNQENDLERPVLLWAPSKTAGQVTPEYTSHQFQKAHLAMNAIKGLLSWFTAAGRCLIPHVIDIAVICRRVEKEIATNPRTSFMLSKLPHSGVKFEVAEHQSKIDITMMV